jgi:hypothetical protein
MDHLVEERAAWIVTSPAELAERIREKATPQILTERFFKPDSLNNIMQAMSLRTGVVPPLLRQPLDRGASAPTGRLGTIPADGPGPRPVDESQGAGTVVIKRGGSCIFKRGE